MKSLSPKRISFSNSPPVQRVLATLPEGESLSRRMATIAERYAIICDDHPTMTDAEREILGRTLKGHRVDHYFVRFFADEVRKAGGGSDQEREALAQRLESLSTGERIALIEDVERQAALTGCP